MVVSRSWTTIEAQKLTLGIAMRPRGRPFQATVRPCVKVITASKGPELLMAPVSPVEKAAGDGISSGRRAHDVLQNAPVFEGLLIKMVSMLRVAWSTIFCTMG